MDKNELIKKIASEPEDKLLLAKVLDKMLECERKNIQTNTPFLNERERALAEKVIAYSGGAKYFACGGYDGAERSVLIFLPEYLDEETAEPPLKFVRARYAKENALTHRDFLGALMGSGIKRETVGDILVSSGSCDIIILEDILRYIMQNLESAGRAQLSLSEITTDELAVPQKKYQLVKDTVASLRLDSVVSSGFSMARGKAAELIRAGRVNLNFIECLKLDKEVVQGDIISARGFGRLEVTKVAGLSRKGRIILEMNKVV